MLQELVFNFCLTVTLAYGLSLTYKSWPDTAGPHLRLLRLALLSSIALLLVAFPAQLAPGVNIDLRAVPVVFVTLRYGAALGLLTAVPALVLRFMQGGVGVPVAVISMLSLILVAALVSRRVLNGGAAWHTLRWPLAVLLFVPNGLAFPLLPNGVHIMKVAYLPLLAANVTAFLLASSIMHSRLKLLQLTHAWQERAQRDHLSGLANRRQFDSDLPTLDSTDLLLMLDVDHFKSINDEFGHPVGDEVLRAIGQALPITLRQADRAYRYGGEEFAVILRHIGMSSPELVAERLRRQIESLSFPQLGDRGVTVSVGVAQAIPGDPQASLRRADQALYAAKQAGRNRVEVWTPALQGGPAR